MDALTVAALAMQDDLARLNSISQNLANVTTPGYKRQIALSRPFGSYLDQMSAERAQPASAVQDTAIDAGAGTLRKTANPLDLAVDGEGFFEIATDAGMAYTRQGTMQVDARGRLVTAQGFALMGMGGELSVNGSSMTIDGKGEVRQGERVVGQIKLVRFANPGSLVALGNGLFGQGAARLADQGQSGAVRTGYQENSNVNSPQEMVRLSETMRHFEAMQKVMQGYDDVFEKTMRKLGEF